MRGLGSGRTLNKLVLSSLTMKLSASCGFISRGTPQRMDLHAWFGADFTPDALTAAIALAWDDARSPLWSRSLPELKPEPFASKAVTTVTMVTDHARSTALSTICDNFVPREQSGVFASVTHTWAQALLHLSQLLLLHFEVSAPRVWPMLLPATGLSFELLLWKAPWLSEKRWRRFNADVYVCVFDPLALLFLPPR